MFSFLVITITVMSILMIVVILMQSGKGGGLAATFGGASSSTDSFIGGRQAANLLTKSTWIGGGLFLFLSLILSILSSQSSQPGSSILRSEFEAAPAPSSLLDTEGDATPLLIPGDDADGAAGAEAADPGAEETPAGE
ncbi:MAG: preprotein translocase subunit SecG [Gemmatimonadota bacterium]